MMSSDEDRIIVTINTANNDNQVVGRSSNQLSSGSNIQHLSCSTGALQVGNRIFQVKTWSSPSVFTYHGKPYNTGSFLVLMTIVQLTRAPPPLHLASATSLLLTSSLPPELTVNILLILLLIVVNIQRIIHIARWASTSVSVGR